MIKGKDWPDGECGGVLVFSTQFQHLSLKYCIHPHSSSHLLLQECWFIVIQVTNHNTDLAEQVEWVYVVAETLMGQGSNRMMWNMKALMVRVGVMLMERKMNDWEHWMLVYYERSIVRWRGARDKGSEEALHGYRLSLTLEFCVWE